ncbi:uncharacterized protein LOC143277132 [Babylonia areolata]|uniref:uncharacterized protein LOC143277132 n=1 Tax=Babylonia areolata TaxID=304850 RepID=UPI003FD521E5
MASAYLGPESPRPLSVISESYRGHVSGRLPRLAALERYSLGEEYEEHLFSLLHKYLELGTTDTLCFVGDNRGGLAQRIEQRFCLTKPVRTLLPGHVHYAETDDRKRVPITISHVGVEDHFRQLVKDQASGKGNAQDGRFDKILLHDVCRYLREPAQLYQDLVQCLTPGGILLVLHRPALLSTLPVFKGAHNRLAENDVPYMDIVQSLQSNQLDVQWELEIVPVRMRKRKWLAMMRDRYPPQLEIMSEPEVLGGLRELTEGVMKYEGDQVEFKDRLLFIKATHSTLENGYPSVQRYSGRKYEPFPAQENLKLTLALPPDADVSLSAAARQDSRPSDTGFKFMWG